MMSTFISSDIIFSDQRSPTHSLKTEFWGRRLGFSYQCRPTLFRITTRSSNSSLLSLLHFGAFDIVAYEKSRSTCALEGGAVLYWRKIFSTSGCFLSISRVLSGSAKYCCILLSARSTHTPDGEKRTAASPSEIVLATNWELLLSRRRRRFHSIANELLEAHAEMVLRLIS